MSKKTIILGAAALTIGGLTLGSTAIDAYQGDPSVQGPNCTGERHEAMEQAFANNDYNAWKELMSGKGRVTQVVNEGNFNRFSEAHQLAEAGKLDESKQIRQELGLGLKDGSGQGQGQQKGQGTGQGRNR